MSDLPDDFKVFRPPATGPDTRNPFIDPYLTPTKHFQAAQSLPDSYFAVTAADVRDSQAVLTARSKALNDAPLVTKGIRDAKEKERLARWPTV
jgi:tether containing UBX domain for GLUT4